MEHQNVLPASRTSGKSGRSAAMKGTKNIHHGSLGQVGAAPTIPNIHSTLSRALHTQQGGYYTATGPHKPRYEPELHRSIVNPTVGMDSMWLGPGMRT